MKKMKYGRKKSLQMGKETSDYEDNKACWSEAPWVR
jgi:hypothetical protein